MIWQDEMINYVKHDNHQIKAETENLEYIEIILLFSFWNSNRDISFPFMI